MDIQVGAATQQSKALTARFRHAVRLLNMSSIEFAASVREALGRNPFLEFEDGDGQGDDGPSSQADVGDDDASPAPADAAPADAGAADAVADPDGRGDDRDLWQADIGSPASTRAGDGEATALDMMPVEGTLSSHLHGQLNLLPLAWRELVIARMVVESLDDDGYLRSPLDELADRAHLSDLDPPARADELETGLRRVQALDPAGVGARSVAECLRLQLPAIACPQERALAEAIVERHLSLLAVGDLGRLATALGAPADAVQAACDRIRRLQPRPGWQFGSGRIAYVVPDVTVKKLGGQWQVQLNPHVVPRVRLNQVYAELFRRHRTANDGPMASHLQEAQWTLRNVEQRFLTIVDVAQAIVRHQTFFFDFGPMAMKPLGLREIAEEVGVHESTVSRVTTGKYMATPAGVFEFKHFFSRAMVTANGSSCSGVAIRSLMQDIIDAESATAPLSDADITRMLCDQGLVVARRTVTKYRQLLRIAPWERRRRLS